MLAKTCARPASQYSGLLPSRSRSTGGCDFAEPGDKSAPVTHLFWHERLDHAVLSASVLASEQSPADVFDLRRFARFAAILQDGAVERLSFSDGYRRVRVNVVQGTVLAGPVRLTFLIADDRHTPVQIAALRQFHALRRFGGFSPSLHQPEPHALQWIRQLRALDALENGISGREIATAIFPDRFARGGWRDGGEPARSAVRRLIATSRRMVAGGYLKLLP